MGRVSLRLCLTGSWDRIEPAREAVGRCVSAVYNDDDLGDALAMAAAELLENALKYGKPDTPVWLTFDEESELTVAVTNVGQPEHLERLTRRIDALRGSDPKTEYLAVVRKLCETGDINSDGVSLGLVRIAYEGGCTLDYDLADGQVTVRARHPLPRRAGET